MGDVEVDNDDNDVDDKNDVDKILRQKIKEKLSPAHSRLGVMFFKKVLAS